MPVSKEDILTQFNQAQTQESKQPSANDILQQFNSQKKSPAGSSNGSNNQTNVSASGVQNQGGSPLQSQLNSENNQGFNDAFIKPIKNSNAPTDNTGNSLTTGMEKFTPPNYQKNVRDNEQIIQQRKIQLQNAIITSAKERLISQGKPTTPQNLNQSITDVNNDINSGKLSVGYDKDGNKEIQTSAGFLDGITNNVANFVNNIKYMPSLAYAKATGDNKTLSDIGEQMSKDKEYINNHPYDALSSLLNTNNPISLSTQADITNDKGESKLNYGSTSAELGQTAGSIGTSLAPLLLPGGEALEGGEEATATLGKQLADNYPRMLASSAQTYANNVPENFSSLYQQNKQTFMNAGMNENDAKLAAAHKSSTDALVQGILPSLAQGAFFSGALHGTPDVGANSFGDALVSTLKNSSKFSAIMGAQAGAEDLVKNWQGYKTNTLDDIGEGMKQGFLQTAAMELLPHALSLPTDLRNQLYNYATKNIAEPTLDAHLQNIPDGAKIAENMTTFKDALAKIPDDVPENKKPDLIPLILQKQSLTDEMNSKDNVFKDSYKNKLSAVDDQINNIIQRTPAEDIADQRAKELLPKLQGKENEETQTPDYLLSRHSDTVKDEQNKVSGTDMNPLSTDGKKDANDLANEVQQHSEQTGVPVSKIVSSDLERAKETAQTVADKTGATVEHDPELRTWDIGEFNDTKDSDFKKVQQWFVEHPDETVYKPDVKTTEGEKPEDKDPLYGKKVGESFNDYAKRTIEAHQKYQGEPASTMLIDHSNNMMVMGAYRKNGNTWDEKAAQDYLKSEKPEPATLQNKIPDNGTVSPQQSTDIRGSEIQPKESNEIPNTTEKTGEPNEGVNQNAQGAGTGKTISTKNSVTDLLRNENGLPPVEIPSDRSKDASLNAWKDGTRHPLQIVDQLLGDKDIYNKSITPNDEPIMREYIRGLTNRGMELNRMNEELGEKVKNGDKDAELDQSTVKQQLLNHYDEMQRALDAERIGGNIWHKYGEERQIAVNEQNQLLNSINRIKTIYGDNIPESVKKQLDDLQKQNDALLAKNAKLEADYRKKSAQNELAKNKPKSTKTKKTSADFSKERDKILSDMKASLNKAKGNTYATFPGVPQLIAIAPHVLDLVKSFGEQGITKLDDMVDKIHAIVNNTVDGIRKEDVRDIIAGKYSNEKESLKREFEKQSEYKKNEDARIALRQKLKNMEEAAYNSQKSMYMRGLDYINRWGRRVIFFGANAVYTKLSSAAVLGSFLHRPFEQIAGKINTELYPNLAKGAPIEGYINLPAEAKFYGEFLNPAKFVKGIWQIGKTGQSRLSAELGSHSSEHHIPILDLFSTDAHIMIKDPVKRATFEASQINHMKYFANNQIDPTHPLMLEAARQAAYKAAEYEIFQNSTKRSSGISHFFDELERKGIANNNMPSNWDKFKGNAQYTAASLYHFFVPINTVPFNILSRVGLGLRTPLTMVEAMAKNKAIKDGILNMSAEESDLLMRQLKKGQIGTAYWTLGFILGGSALGGLWTRYDPDKKRGNAPKSDQMRLGSINVPKDVQHNTQLQSMQMGATWRTVHDHFIHGQSKSSQLDAIYKATMATGGAALEDVPSLEQGGKLYDAATTPYGADKFVTDLKRRVGVGKAVNVLHLMGYGQQDNSTKDFGGAGASNGW